MIIRNKHFLLTVAVILVWILLLTPAEAAGVATVPDDLVNCTPLINVMSPNDDGSGSLRQAINDVCDGGQIGFNLPPGSYITLLTGQLLIEKSLQLIGPGSATLSLRSLDDGRILHIASSGTVEISDMSLLNGLATDGTEGTPEGGAILNEGNLTLTNVTIVGNSAAAPGRGGGIANIGGTVTIVGGIFAGNQVNGANGEGNGGAIYNDENGSIAISGTTFWANEAYANGGAIDNHGTITIINSSLSENSSFTGGAIANRGGSLYLDYTTIFQNTANVYGGGILNNGALVMDTSTISGNESAGGGGIHNEGGNVTITNSTLTLNQATQGAGISSTATGTFSLQNSIIAQNSGEECALPDSVVLSQGYNLAGDASCHLTAASDLTQQDARLGPLLPNGGPTETHALLADSPALDAGNCEETSVDQRGQTRPIDIPSLSDGGNGCDMGAYEATNAALGLIIGMDDQASLLPGQPLTYTIRFNNDNSSTVSQAIITNTVSVPLTDIAFTSSGVAITPMAGSGSTSVWQVANMSPGASGVITVTARVNETLVANTSLVSSAVIRGHSNLTDFADGWGQASVNLSVPQVSFELAAFTVNENAGTAIISVKLTTANPFAPARVSYETIDGTAIAGEDYVSVSDQLTIAAGESQQTFTVPIIDNAPADGDRSLTLRLFAPIGMALTPAAPGQLIITDNDYMLLLPMVFRP